MKGSTDHLQLVIGVCYVKPKIHFAPHVLVLFPPTKVTPSFMVYCLLKPRTLSLICSIISRKLSFHTHFSFQLSKWVRPWCSAASTTEDSMV